MCFQVDYCGAFKSTFLVHSILQVDHDVYQVSSNEKTEWISTMSNNSQVINHHAFNSIIVHDSTIIEKID